MICMQEFYSAKVKHLSTTFRIFSAKFFLYEWSVTPSSNSQLLFNSYPENEWLRFDYLQRNFSRNYLGLGELKYLHSIYC